MTENKVPFEYDFENCKEVAIIDDIPETKPLDIVISNIIKDKP